MKVACSVCGTEIETRYSQRRTCGRKKCVRAFQRKRWAMRTAKQRADTLEKTHYRQLKKLYGMDREDWQRLHDRQGGKCAVCAAPFKSSKTTHVDHDHETGKVRGLLCHSCNRGLGWLKDDVEILSSALRYLETFISL